MHYLSVIQSSLGAEKKSHIQEEEIGLFSWLFYLNVDLKIIKSSISVALERVPLSLVYPFKIYCMKKSSINFSYVAPPACFWAKPGKFWGKSRKLFLFMFSETSSTCLSTGFCIMPSDRSSLALLPRLSIRTSSCQCRHTTSCPFKSIFEMHSGRITWLKELLPTI